jgi:hypothetical protein
MEINDWLKSFWNVIIYPFNALNHFLFENDAHHIVSRRGWDIIYKERNDRKSKAKG